MEIASFQQVGHFLEELQWMNSNRSGTTVAFKWLKKLAKDLTTHLCQTWLVPQGIDSFAFYSSRHSQRMNTRQGVNVGVDINVGYESDCRFYSVINFELDCKVSMKKTCVKDYLALATNTHEQLKVFLLGLSSEVA